MTIEYIVPCTERYITPWLTSIFFSLEEAVEGQNARVRLAAAHDDGT
jgi:hypothetical protein